jgi:hypothetical protein
MPCFWNGGYIYNKAISVQSNNHGGNYFFRISIEGKLLHYEIGINDKKVCIVLQNQ